MPTDPMQDVFYEWCQRYPEPSWTTVWSGPKSVSDGVTDYYRFGEVDLTEENAYPSYLFELELD